jgi:hypothetical protein
MKVGWGESTPINLYFPDSHEHHFHINECGEIDHQITMFIPDEVHCNVWHSSGTWKGMPDIAYEIVKWYEGIDDNDSEILFRLYQILDASINENYQTVADYDIV